MKKIKRINKGDIYYVMGDQDTPPIGSEIWSDRAAIIVSNDGLNNTSGAVEVVYLSTSDKKRTAPTHVKVMSSGKIATAHCEQIHSIDKSRLAQYMGTITNDELDEINEALMFGLQINKGVNPQGIFRKWENYLRTYDVLSTSL